MNAYCVKCRQRRDTKDDEQIVTKNNKTATRGLCSVCGTVVYKLGT